MAFTHRVRARWDSGPVTPAGILDNVFTDIAVVRSSITDIRPWTLQRTFADIVVDATVPDGTVLPTGWWSGASVRLGLKHSPDGSDPGMVRNDDSEEVLGIAKLVPSVSGNLIAGGAHTVSWQLHRVFENRTQRSAPATVGIPSVFAYLWAVDDAFILTGTHPAVVIGYSVEISTLWAAP